MGEEMEEEMEKEVWQEEGAKHLGGQIVVWSDSFSEERHKVGIIQENEEKGRMGRCRGRCRGKWG